MKHEKSTRNTKPIKKSDEEIPSVKKHETINRRWSYCLEILKTQ